MGKSKRVNFNHSIAITAKYTGYTQEVVKDILSGYIYIIMESIKNNYEISVPYLGRFCLTRRNAQAGRKFKQPSNGEIIDLQPRPAYKKPCFKFTPTFKQLIRELTEENTY